MGNQFLKRDYLLLKQVRGKARDYVDGCVRVETRGGHVRVYLYSRQIFHWNTADGFFEATTYGKDEKWVQDKLNACLTAAHIGCRVFVRRDNTLGVVNSLGNEQGAFKFNSKTTGEFAR